MKSDEIEKVVDSILPMTNLIKEEEYGYVTAIRRLRQAISEGKLVLPPSEEKLVSLCRSWVNNSRGLALAILKLMRGQ